MASGWLKGVVKGVVSGDCLLIAGSTGAALPPEKQITLSSLVAPRLVRRRTPLFRLLLLRLALKQWCTARARPPRVPPRSPRQSS